MSARHFFGLAGKVPGTFSVQKALETSNPP